MRSAAGRFALRQHIGVATGVLDPAPVTFGRDAGRAQQHVAKILQLGMGGICAVGYGRSCHFGVLRTGKEEELLDLMRGNISEDAAITLALEEPTGPRKLGRCDAGPARQY